MFHTSTRTSALLAIALGVTAIGSATTPAAATTVQSGGGNLGLGASSKLKPIEAPFERLPRLEYSLKSAPSYCELHNCIVPSRN